ncbi:uncharacterized protein LOC108732875 [Agrilus planipennis]|uniref:Uncharacterized protein LOC108732875 n=1 Tax=Agrilus planipennis TaxID=224129 RepID=A0A1W4WH79_AGRPL|nr:uncharacterized protein LOC108732875 [Agrilus planipennis]XP_018319371.1 uncharacterized protein LOC108732875 [Agrilus planipennis]
MARKRRRGASSAGKRQPKVTKRLPESNNTEIVYEGCSDNSNGTVSAATTDQASSSENSNLEMKIVTEGVHKKFGKFRCVIEETEDPLKIDNTQNEIAYVNTEETFVDSEVKPFLENETFAVEEVHTCSSEDVLNEENVEIITVEDNSISSDQTGTIYITLDENEKGVGSFKNTNEHFVKENEKQNDDLLEISNFVKNHEDNGIIECNIVNNEGITINNDEYIANNEDNAIKNEENSDNKETIIDREDILNTETINQGIVAEDDTEEGIVYMHEEELQLEEIVDNEEELKIANKLSALNVNVENENMDVIDNNDDSQKSHEIVYDMENLGFELTIECGPEEVVPTEQEIEYGNGDKMKEVSE